MRSTFVRVIAAVSVAFAVSACNRSGGGEDAAAAKPAAEAPKEQFTEPRFPGYLKKPANIEELMPNARSFARTKAWRGGTGLGVLNDGDSVLIVTEPEAEEMILEAIRRAAAERNVTVVFKPAYEMVGISKADAEEYERARRTYTAEAGYMEAANWVESQFPDAPKAKAWIKEQNPQLYDVLFPKSRDLSPKLQAIREKLSRNSVGKAIQAHLRANPKVKGVFWGKGGGPGAMRALYPLDKQYMGFFTADNRWEMMSELTTYPTDVWLLTEEQSMEPLAYVSRLEVTDPEGTNVWADVTEDMAARWVKGAYQRGHLYLFPNQASGRFGYSVVDYPALQAQWIPREPMTMIHGVIAATNGHGGFFPRMEVEYRDGYIHEVRGGGHYGDLFRLMQKYPNINDVQYPFHNRKGYWWLYEIASGTHPKWFRNPDVMEGGGLTPERNRSAVIHWGHGLRLWHDPDAPIESPSWLKVTAQYNTPRDHGFHMHSYFITYRVHLRNADKWINLIEKGRLKSLDSPEARALASRYGNPDVILAEDWVPEVPGINAPGDYARDYAPAPYKVAKRVIDEAVNGTYAHYYPKPAQGAPAATTQGGR
jgi:hypothetical protein